MNENSLKAVIRKSDSPWTSSSNQVGSVITIMKLKLEKQPLAQGSSKTLGGAIIMCSQDLKVLQNL